VASPPASVEEIAIAAARLETLRSAAWVAGNHSDDGLSMSSEDAANLAVYLDALLSDRSAMAERVAGLERERDELREALEGETQSADHGWKMAHIEDARAEASEAEVARLREALERRGRLIDCLLDNDPEEVISDAGHTVLQAWRHDAEREMGRAALIRPMGEPKLPDGWLKEGIDAALTRPDEPTKET